MAGITSVTINGLNIADGTIYESGAAMASALEAADPYEALFLEMSGRPDYYVRAEIQERVIPLVVHLLGTTFAARQAAFDTIKTAIIPGLLNCDWVRDGITRRYIVNVTSAPLTDTFFHRVTGELTAADPRAITV